MKKRGFNLRGISNKWSVTIYSNEVQGNRVIGNQVIGGIDLPITDNRLLITRILLPITKVL